MNKPITPKEMEDWVGETWDRCQKEAWSEPMNRDDIIRLAREAGLFHFYDSEGHCDGITDARLITEDEQRDDDRLVEMLAPFAALVAAAEREACAKVCDDWPNGRDDVYSIGVAIRARGEK